MDLLSLNSDCLGLILDQVGIKELTQLAQVNQSFHSVIQRRVGYLGAQKKFIFHRNVRYRFYWLCHEGYLTLAQNYYHDHSINSYFVNEDAFYASCDNGQLEVAKWIWGLGGKFNIYSYEGSHSLVNWQGQLEVRKWLRSLQKKIYLREHGGNI